MQKTSVNSVSKQLRFDGNGNQPHMVNAHRLKMQNIVSALLILATTACSVQPVVRSFSDLDQRLKPGSIVYITNHDGVKVRAIITELKANELMVEVNGSSLTMEEHQIRQIDRHDNIILQGFGIGLGAGILNAVFSDPPYERCENDPSRQCAVEDSKERLIFTGILAIAGAGAGAFIRRRDDPVYLAPEIVTQRSRPPISITPVVNGNTSMPGLSVKLRF